MKLFKSVSKTIDIKVVDLPRSHYKWMPPKKWQIALVIIGIIVTSFVWAIL